MDSKRLHREHNVTESQTNKRSAEVTNVATLKPDKERLQMVSFTKIILWKESMKENKKSLTMEPETPFMCGLKRRERDTWIYANDCGLKNCWKTLLQNLQK